VSELDKTAAVAFGLPWWPRGGSIGIVGLFTT